MEKKKYIYIYGKKNLIIYFKRHVMFTKADESVFCSGKKKLHSFFKPALLRSKTKHNFWISYRWINILSPRILIVNICETSRLPHFLDNRLTNGAEVSLMRPPPFTPRKKFLILISVRGSVELRAIVRLEGLRQLKKKIQWSYMDSNPLPHVHIQLWVFRIIFWK
jgi:hypothetical protein